MDQFGWVCSNSPGKPGVRIITSHTRRTGPRLRQASSLDLGTFKAGSTPWPHPHGLLAPPATLTPNLKLPRLSKLRGGGGTLATFTMQYVFEVLVPPMLCSTEIYLYITCRGGGYWIQIDPRTDLDLHLAF